MDSPQLHIPRDALTAEATSQLQSEGLLILLGDSGCGKTATAKKVVDGIGVGGNPLWFRADQFGSGAYGSLAGRICLRHPLAEVIECGAKTAGVLVIDGAERLVESEDFEHVCEIASPLLREWGTVKWLVLVTCQSQAWNRVAPQLSRAVGCAKPLSTVVVENPQAQALGGIWSAFPALRQLVLVPHLSSLLCNLKVLDALAAHAGVLPDTAKLQWAGESDLVAWFWQSVVLQGKDGRVRAGALQRLAQLQGDERVFETPSMTLKPAEVSALETAERSGLCAFSDEGRVEFAHDLYADWARMRCVLAHESSLPSYLESRTSIPHWHNAIRLYAVHLLEHGTVPNAWGQSMERMPDIRNLFLEGIAMARDSFRLLDQAWPALADKDGQLLQALLKRFLHVATRPDPSLIDAAADDDTGVLGIRTQDRVPILSYWPGMLRFLCGRLREVAAMVPEETALILQRWLVCLPPQAPLYREAAMAAVQLGRQALLSRGARPYRDADLTKCLYQACLGAARALPDEVAEIALFAGGRKLPSGLDEDVLDYTPPGIVVECDGLFGKAAKPMPKPWPHGPLFSPDREFAEVCTDSDALAPLMDVRPEVAREVILALAIEPRQPDFSEIFGSSPLDPWEDVSVARFRCISFPYYFQGPFLRFLQANPGDAAETIIRLVNFATDRYCENLRPRDEPPEHVTVESGASVREWAGDYKVFYWFRAAAWFPPTVACALMAVEKWLYNCLDPENPNDSLALPVIEKVMAASRSAAFAGVLIEVGKFRPDLFVSVLRPLLCVADWYLFENESQRGGLGRMGVSPPYLCNQEWVWESVQQWNTMPHRKLGLQDAAVGLFLRVSGVEDTLSTAAREWRERAATGSEDESTCLQLGCLAAQFDPDNWSRTPAEGGKTRVEYTPPEDLALKAETRQRNATAKLNLLTFPMDCWCYLRGEKSLLPTQVSDFWQRMQDLLSQDSIDAEGNPSAVNTDCLCGGLAVLFLLCRDWLSTDEEREQWCREHLGWALLQPSALNHSRLMGEFDTWESGAQHFLARLLPALWAEEPDSEVWPEGVAALCFSCQYKTVELLLASAFDVREVLGDRFGRLVDLVLGTGVWRWEMPHPNRARRSALTADELKEKAEALVEAFLGGTALAATSQWGQKAASQGFLWTGHRRFRDTSAAASERRALMKIPRIDLPLVAHVFNGILLPSQASSKEERTKWLAFWDQVVLCWMSTLAPYAEDGQGMGPEAGVLAYPTMDSDSWFLDTCALLALETHGDERPARYWLPLFELGPRATAWIQSFFSSWLAKGFRLDFPGDFCKRWSEMLDFLRDGTPWRSVMAHACEEHRLWECALGIDGIDPESWMPSHEHAAKTMASYYLTQAEQLKTDQQATGLLRWLVRDAAGPVRCSMLPALAGAVSRGGKSWWHADGEGDLCRYLSHCWATQQADILRTPGNSKAFWDLLHALTERHCPMALDLESRIAAGR
jgi:hypothetical protein